MDYIFFLVHDMVISLQYFPSTEQIADIFTKDFTRKTFTYLRSLIGASEGWSVNVIYCSSIPMSILEGRFCPMWFSFFSSVYRANKISELCN